MTSTINFDPGSYIGEIVIVDGKSWTWDGKKWVLTDGFTTASDIFVKKEGDTMSGDLLLQDADGDPAEYDNLTDKSAAVNKKYVDEKFLTDEKRLVYFNNPDIEEYRMTYINNPLNNQDFDTTIDPNLFKNQALNGGHSVTSAKPNSFSGYHCIHEDYLQSVLSLEDYNFIDEHGSFNLDFNGVAPNVSSYNNQPPSGAVWHYSGVAVVPGEANRLLSDDFTDLDGYCVKSDGTPNVSYADAAKASLLTTISHDNHAYTDVKSGTYVRGILKKVQDPNGGFYISLIEDPTSPVFFTPVSAYPGITTVKIHSVALRNVGGFVITLKSEKYALGADVDQLEQDLISLDEEIESIIPSVERGQWEYKQSSDTGTEPEEGCYYLVKDYNPGDDISTASFTNQYREATAVVFNNKQWAEDMSLATEHEWGTVEVDEMIDLLDKPDPDGLYGKITGVDDSRFANSVIIAFNKLESIGSPTNNILSNLTRLKIFKEPTGEVPFFPVGVIMPYVGTSAPRGWLLCTGGIIPTEYTVLRSMVGDSTPNLKGRFLGGAGSSGMTLKGTYGQSTSEPSGLRLSSETGGSHSHYFSENGTTAKDGSHNHQIGNTGNTDGNRSAGRFYPDTNGSARTSTAGEHTHSFSVSGNTRNHDGHTHTINSTGWDSYTRPYTYAVNYIIKHD